MADALTMADSLVGLKRVSSLCTEIKILGQKRKIFAKFVKKVQNLIKKKRKILGCNIYTFGPYLSSHELHTLNQYLNSCEDSDFKKILPFLYVIRCWKNNDFLECMVED